MFNRNPDYEYDLKPDDILKTYTVDDKTRSTYMKNYKELFRHIHDSGVMSQHMVQGCKYISYMLRNHVTSNLNYNFETFKIFHKFVEAYYKHQRSYDKLCLPNMVYIDDDMYKKMDALYRMYDAYTEFLSSNKSWKVTSCNDLKFFVTTYNEYIRGHESTSKHLNGILEDFEKVLSTTVDKHKNGCSYDYTLTPIIKFIEKTKQQPIKDNRETHPPNTTALVEKPSLPAQPEVTSLHDTSRHNEGTPIQAERLGSRESEYSRAHALETHQTEEAEEREIVRTALPDRRTLRTYSHHDPLSTLRLIPGGESSEQLTLMQESSYNLQNGLEVDQGFMANVRNTITGVLGEVDPVPVVGVSGGMEEADVDNESLIDFMENIQNFFQDFKDMEMDIFQMIDLI
ncbi:hypothetical protein PVBG_05450 [Plasmodium vivax Brazil I]|uniref:Uncharacterized protein n=1 Tax=Plasmodium vivax (strain Brazil I) TaxID=1033975 RepID=A0A0J9T1M7_PLAV1|nr:hypothetical protein PVBG_05450 [Plasmodium vivax Brazil I]